MRRRRNGTANEKSRHKISVRRLSSSLVERIRIRQILYAELGVLLFASESNNEILKLHLVTLSALVIQMMMNHIAKPAQKYVECVSVAIKKMKK